MYSVRTCTWCNGQVLWLTICTAAVGFLPREGDTKRKVVDNVLIHCFVFLSSALSAVINYHDIQNRPGRTGICVANHTSPIDVLVLMCDNCYSLVSKGMWGIKPFLIVGFGSFSIQCFVYWYFVVVIYQLNSDKFVQKNEKHLRNYGFISQCQFFIPYFFMVLFMPVIFEFYFGSTSSISLDGGYFFSICSLIWVHFY